MRRGWCATCLLLGLQLGLGGAVLGDGLSDIRSAIREQDKGHDQIGILLYSSAIRDPSLSDADRLVAYYNRADAYRVDGQYDDAIGDFNQILRLNPGDTVAYYNRGEVYWAKGDRDKAIADYTESLRLDPRAAWAYCARGNVYRAKSDYSRALQDYNAALQYSPFDPWINYSRGMAYKDTGDYPRAIADYTEALRLDPKYVNAYFFRAQSQRTLGALDQAVSDYTQVLRLTPNNSTAYYNRANVYRDLGAADRAVADYSQALRLSPRDAWAYFNRAQLYLEQGQFEDAIADYQSTLAHSSQNADALFGLGAAQYLSGRYGAAAEAMSQALGAASDSMLGAEIGAASGDAQARYRLIWRYLARRRAGQDGAGELRQAMAGAHDGGWPAPVLDYLAGTISADQLRALAAAADAGHSQDRSCEAWAYIGEAQLLSGARDEALRQLQLAHAQCPANFIEATLAATELRRLTSAQ